MAKSLLYFYGGKHRPWARQFPSGAAPYTESTNGRWGQSGYGAFSGSRVSYGSGASIYPTDRQPADTGNIGNYTRGAITIALGVEVTNTGIWHFQVGDAATGCQLTITFDNRDNTFSVYRGTTSGTALVSSTSMGSAFNRLAGVWTPIQIGWKIDPTAGEVWIRASGTVLTNLTGVNTRNTANTQWNRLLLGCGFDPTYGYVINCADVGIWDMDTDPYTDLQKEYRVVNGVPSGDNSVQFTRSTGSVNAQNVDDDYTDGDSTYNYSSTVGHVDRMDMSGSWVPSGATIWGTQTHLMGRIDDATPRDVRAKVWSGASSANQTTFSLTSTNLSFIHRIDNDPDTAAGWTASGLNSADLGYEVVA